MRSPLNLSCVALIFNVVKSLSAFAYAKFSDRRQKDEDEEDSKKGSSAARRAAMEETVGKDEKKRRKSQKVVENPTNKMKPVRFTQHTVCNSTVLERRMSCLFPKHNEIKAWNVSLKGLNQ